MNPRALTEQPHCPLLDDQTRSSAWGHLPSACVPAGRDEATGLPIGVLVTGRRFREDLCLEAAEAIEARLGLPTPIDPVR